MKVYCSTRNVYSYAQLFFDCLDNSYHPKFRSTGCIPFVDKTDLLDEEKGVDVILMEEDAIDYSEWYVKLYQRNYKCIWYIRDTYVKRGKKPEWSIKMRHSVWIHDRVLSDRKFPQSCKEYVESQNFTSQQIDCAECPL